MDYLRLTSSNRAPRQFTDPFFEALDGFPVDSDLRILSAFGEAEPQIFKLPGTSYLAFLIVYLQPKFPCYEPIDTRKHPLGCRRRSDEDYKVVCVANKS